MKRLALSVGGLALAGLAFGLWLTAPQGLEDARLAALPEGDPARGEQIFWAGGCASCHAAPGATGDAKLVLTGGLELKTDFGVFVAPNISPHPEAGIGGWTLAEFANAMAAGVSPDGQHYYPAFPYSSYARMRDADIADLFAFMRTLPASESIAGPNRLGFPFSIRASVGGWKLLYGPGGWLTGHLIPAVDMADERIARGAYLVNGPGHCGECHSPRNALGGFVADAWLSGADNPDGDGRIPNITPGARDIGPWSATDISYYLESGFTPDFDSVGGSMVSVQANMAKLPKSDLDAIAAYLKAIPVIAE